MKNLILFLLAILLGNITSAQNIGDLRSKTPSGGNWSNASSWEVWAGYWKAAAASDIPGSGTTKVITIRTGHTIYFDGGKYAYDLIIESGAVLTENPIGSSVRSLTIYHNLVCNGSMGNGSTPGKITLTFQGNCSISGGGTINCAQIRNNIGYSANLEINSNVTLRAGGLELYNYSPNNLFNIHIASGCTLNCAGNGVTGGDINLDSSPGSVYEYGGTITVDGTLIISGIFYASSNNAIYGCTYNINSGGTISSNQIIMGASGSAGTTLNINAGGKLNIIGSDGSTVFSSTNNAINLNGIFEYSSSGVQTIRALNYSNLKIGGGGIKTLEAGKTTNINSNGTLEMSGGSLSTGTGTLNISSDGSTLLYSSTTDQITGVEWEYPFENLTINKTGTLSISSSKSFNGTLNFLSGQLYLDNNNLQAAGILGGNSNAYVVENGTGKLKVLVSGTVLFPIGESGTSYNPVSLNNSGGTADYYNVGIRTSTEGTYNNTGVINKQWTITEDNPGGSHLLLTLQWNSSDEIAPFNRSNASVGIKGDIYFDLLLSSGTSGSDPYTISTIAPYTQDISMGKTFTVGNSGFFPVELQSFIYQVNGSDVNLKWRTITELNNAGFLVQRKSNKDDWTNLAFIASVGNSNVPREYKCTDKVISGHYNYRLKILDTDGGCKYSDVIDVDVKSPKRFELQQNYPNPFNPTTKIKYSVPEGVHNIKLAVYDLLGKEITLLVNEKKEGGEYEVTFDPKQLSSGVYVYRLASDSYSEMKKFVYIR